MKIDLNASKKAIIDFLSKFSGEESYKPSEAFLFAIVFALLYIGDSIQDLKKNDTK